MCNSDDFIKTFNRLDSIQLARLAEYATLYLHPVLSHFNCATVPQFVRDVCTQHKDIEYEYKKVRHMGSAEMITVLKTVHDHTYWDVPIMLHCMLIMACAVREDRRKITQPKFVALPEQPTTKWECPVCMEAVDTKKCLQPCYHVVCTKCDPKLVTCPICRKKPTSRHNVYF